MTSGGHDYDQIWAEVYGDMQAHGPVHKHLTRLVGRELARLPYRSAFDVGCGPGHNHDLLAAGRSLDRFGGMDISANALEVARSRYPDGAFSVGDVQVDAVPGHWDLVFCSLVLEHLVDDEAALANMRSAVGQHLVLTTIAGNFERYRAWDERMGHVRNYRRGDLEAKVEEAGFRVITSRYWGWPFYSPIVRTVQNRTAVGTGEYGRGTRAIARALELVYHLNSSTRGDLLIVVAAPD